MESSCFNNRKIFKFVPTRVLRRAIVVSCAILLTLAVLNQMDAVHRLWNNIFFPPQYEIPGQCQLPKLNPFHDSIMRYMKVPERLQCEEDFFSTFDGKKLHVFGDGITHVEYSTIKRKENDDFIPDVSESVNIPIQEKYQKRLFLYEGYRGRIEDEKGRSVSPLGRSISDGSPLFLQAVTDTDLTYFTVDEKGILMHESSGKCIQPGTLTIPVEGSAVILHDSCTMLSAQFSITAVGALLHHSSGLCLGTKMSGEKIKVDNLVLTKECKGFFTMKQVTETAVKSECIEVKVKKTDGAEYLNMHTNVVPRPEVLERENGKQEIQANILLLMLDSVSNAHFHRAMPKTLKYLKEDLGIIEMKGQSIVGDGTTAQLTAMLTGKTEWDYPEARTKIPGAKQVDDWDFIFKDFKKHGYSTMYMEEGSNYGTFQYRLLGFKNPPTDHYPRPCWMHYYDKYDTSNDCLGSIPLYRASLDYCSNFFKAYPNTPKFAFTLISTSTHNNPHTVQLTDIPVKSFLKSLKEKSQLDNTILIVFGDHGYRFSWLRATIQGQLEERLPFMAVHFPKWFKQKYPDLYQNMEYNSQFLTSPFDFYATLRHVLSYPKYPTNITTGQSLFKKINPETRTCADTGIANHWCPCLKWEEVDTGTEIVSQVVTLALNHFNKILTSNSDLRKLCHPLSIKEILNAVKQMPNKEVQSFQKTTLENTCDGCKAVFGKRSQDTMAKNTVYQIRMKTHPNDGLYEVTVTFSQGHSNVTGISRLNMYKDHIGCIRNTYVHAHKYCYCKDLLN